MSTAWAVVVIAVLAIVVPAVDRIYERRHARVIARAGRLHGQRLTVYNEVAVQFERMRQFALRTHPMWEPAPPPPEPLNEDELRSIAGRLSVGGSPESLAAATTTTERLAQFRYAVYVYEERRKNPALDWTEERQAMDEARDAVGVAVDEAEQLMRDELREL